MTTVAAPPQKAIAAAPKSSAPAQQAELLERSYIDASTRAPVLAFFATGIVWLLIATALGLLATFKLHRPEFLGSLAWFSYGRLYPAYQNAFIFGWGCLAGMGVAIWLMARLCRVSLPAPGVLVYGVHFWNVGVLAGVASIIGGKGRGVEGLEMPLFSHVLMFLGFVMIGLWGAVLYRHRRQETAFISVWYLLGAFFWLPWILATANVLVSRQEVRGVMQAVVGAWFSGNLYGWWFTAVALAAAYFLIPKVIDRPIYSYNLASTGFWTFAFLSGLTAMVHLSGGPVPVWLVTLSIAATIMMLVPVATVTVNLMFTMRSKFNMVFHSPTVRFILVGVISFAIVGVLNTLTAMRSVDSVLHFTLFTAGQQQLLLYSFFSMVMFGSIYYITPRLVGCEWLSSSMISTHFWTAAYGGFLLALLMLFGGLVQGFSLAGDSSFNQVMEVTSLYFPGRTLAFFFVAVGHAIFAFHFLLMLLRIGQPGGEPTLFAPMEEEGH